MPEVEVVSDVKVPEVSAEILAPLVSGDMSMLSGKRGYPCLTMCR